MARRGVLGLVAGGAGFLLSDCSLLGDNSYRFRMTVAVDTPLGCGPARLFIKCGRGVTASSWLQRPSATGR